MPTKVLEFVEVNLIQAAHTRFNKLYLVCLWSSSGKVYVASETKIIFDFPQSIEGQFLHEFAR